MNNLFEMTTDGVLVPFLTKEEDSAAESLTSLRARFGFQEREEHSIGDNTSDCLAWYKRSGVDGHEYLAIWSNITDCRIIFVPDWPTLVKLQSLAIPIIHAALTNYRLEVLEGIARKAFRGWHEHEADSYCWKCDPERMKSDELRRQQRNQMKADGNGALFIHGDST